jgi:branched-chain amino acid transport system substrate-binding protein
MKRLLLATGATLFALAMPVAAQQQGVTADTITIGAHGPITGPAAYIGLAGRDGMLLAIKEINAAGGVNGRKIAAVFEDDGHSPTRALAAVKKLVEQDKVFAIIIPQGSPPVVATLEYLEENKVPMLFPYQSSPVTRGKRYVLQGMTLSDRSSKMMIDYLAGQRKLKKFAALYQDDEYGKSFLTAFEKDLGRFGLKLVAAESVKRGVTDVSAQIAKLQAAKPEVTFLVLVPGPGAQALKERQKIGWNDTLMVSTGPLTDERYLALAGDASDGVEGLSLWPDPVTSDLPGVKLYREHMQRYFPKNEPNRYSIAGYFAAMLFTEGAKRAGRNLTRESLIASLESVKGFESGILPPITIGPDHETQKQGFWVRVEKGRFKQLTDWLKSE